MPSLSSIRLPPEIGAAFDFMSFLAGKINRFCE
jgi:hypothetical protein